MLPDWYIPGTARKAMLSRFQPLVGLIHRLNLNLRSHFATLAPITSNALPREDLKPRQSGLLSRV